jgi:hypothetical protein
MRAEKQKMLRGPGSTVRNLLMNKTQSIALFVVSLALVLLGFILRNSRNTDFSRLFSEFPNDRALWLLLVGGITAVISIVGWIRSTRIH